MTIAQETIAIIDWSAIFWTAWHSSGEDDVSAARHRTMGMLAKYSEGYDHVVCAMDSPRSFRKEKHASYKANREPKPANALEELRRTQEETEAVYHTLGADGFEGDDVIATLARWAYNAEQFAATIVGVDKDLMQCLRPNGIALLKFTTGEHFNDADLFEKLKIRPQQVTDWLALMGDKSDNVRGVAGCGSKTAAWLLEQFESIDGIRVMLESNVTAMGGKKALTAALREAFHEETGWINDSLELVTLSSDVLSADECAVVLTRKEQKPITTANPMEATMPGTDLDEETPDASYEETEREPVPEAEPTAPSQPDPPKSDPMPAEPTKALATVPVKWERQLEPQSMGSAYKLAASAHQSRMFTKAFGNVDQCFAIILMGRSLGIDSMTALRGIYMVKGRPTLSAQLIIGLVLNSGKAEYFHLEESTLEKAVYTTKRKGAPKHVTMEFTVEDQERAKLGNDGSAWDTYPKTMLRHRASTELARAVYPDVVSNVYTADELSADEYEQRDQ